MSTRRPRPSGFTDAELAAAAWKRNMQIRGTMAHENELLREKGAKKAERKKKTNLGGGEERRGRKAKRKRGKRGERSRSVSMGSADSLGRERKTRRSRSPGGNSSDSSRERRHNSRRRKRARERGDHNAEFEEMEKALGWRAAMARASRSPSVDPVGGEDRRKGWSSSSSAGSFTSDRGTDGESDVEPIGIVEEMVRSDVGPPVAGLLGDAADVPPDPLRIEHDDRERRWRGGWQPGVSVGIMARGARGSGTGGASRNSSGQGRGRQRDLDEGEFYRERGRGRRSSRERKRRSRSRSPGGEDSARSLSRSISRDRRSRRSSRSRSPSCRRSRSRDRTVWSLIEQFRGKDNPSEVTGGRPESRADSVKAWTHDLYEETTGDSPPRPRLPPGWKPEPESWVSRAGGVYLPVKPPP